MTSKEFSCAAQRSLQEVKARQASNPNSPFYTTQHQNISGVIVPATTVPPKFPIVDSAHQTQLSKGFQTYGQDPTPVPLKRASFSRANATEHIHTRDAMASTVEGRAASNKVRVSKSGVLYALHLIREPVVDYQETRGIARNEEITFVTLVTSLCTQAYTAAITILVMLWNLMPLVDGLVYFVRFFLDKVIDIVETEDNKDRAIKGAILFGELTVVFFIIFMIVGLIFMPVYQLMSRLFSKVFSMVAW